MDLDRARFLAAASRYPIPHGIRFSYGTTGFRTDASLLDAVAFRTGIVAALRSLHMRQATGLMITASHNPVHDNGVKVADPGGDMLSQGWEPFAESLANTQSPEEAFQLVQVFMRKDITPTANVLGRVILARDTRPSGENLLSAAKQGVEVIPGVVADVAGVLTTPQLHWMVRLTNRGYKAQESDYYLQLSNGFMCLLEMKSAGKGHDTLSTNFIVDGANGVGALKLMQLQCLLSDSLKLDIRNAGSEGEGTLNYLVGADFVQKEKVFPCGFGHPDESGRRCASLDGDADRIVFFYGEATQGGTVQRLQLLDGDKILALFAIFVGQQLKDLCTCDSENGHANLGGYGSVRFGVVQTAYANGASTKFLQEKLNLQVALTSTGVKHLHHKAAEYDIGIYFEANGHGTVLFKDELLQYLRTLHPEENDYSGAKWRAAQRLLAVSEVVNQAIGDAFSGLLLVEAILKYQGWSIQDWDAIYSDLPSKQTKVKVKDRTSIRTTNAETLVTHPQALQAAIDIEAGKINTGRAFVRPSGTEDVVRVYAEAATQDEANILAYAVATHVFNLADGVGASPSLEL